MISKIQISNIRGIKDKIEIDLDGKSLVIFGENGTGKSSIVDAIDLAINKRINHLENNGKDVALIKHGHHIHSSPKEMLVFLTFNDSSVLDNIQEVEQGTKAALLREGAKGGVNVLRRAQLLDAINSVPKNRYELLKPFLPLETINTYEQSIKNALNELKREEEYYSKLYNTNRQKITYKLNLADSYGLNQKIIIDVVSRLCDKVGILSPEGFEDLDRISKSAKKILESYGNRNKSNKIQEFVHIIDKLDKREIEPIRLIDDAWGKYISFSRLSSELKELFYEQVLSLGAKWIEEANNSNCPLCESPIRPEFLLPRIKERLEEHKEYIDNRTEFKNSIKKLDNEIAWWQNAVNDLEDVYKTLCDDQIKVIIDTLNNTIQKCKLFTLKDENSRILEMDQPKWNKIDYIAFRNKYTSYLPDNEITNKITNLFNLIESVEVIQENYSTLVKFENDLEIAQRRVKIVQLFYDQMVEERKKSVQEIYLQIKEDINYFYSRIHPSEKIGNIDLIVKESSGGSVLIQSTFFEKSNEDPRAYYSESHLDTLGLSIFFALYKKEAERNPGLRVIVLDDVLHSVDAPHRKRVANLILTEFKDHQLIITTHDTVWFNDLQRIQAGKGKGFKFAQITDWSLQNGLKLDLPKSEVKKLEEMLNSSLDKSGISGKSGYVLEIILSEIRYSFKLSVPAKRKEKYTIGDIWPAFYSKKNHFVKKVNESDQKVLDDIQLFLDLRNDLGSHYNEWADQISMKEARQFAESVLKLWNLLFCDACNEFIEKRDQKEIYFSCKCQILCY